GEGHALGVVAGGRGHHQVVGGGEVGDQVVGATDLERAGPLAVLLLHQHLPAAQPRQVPRPGGGRGPQDAPEALPSRLDRVDPDQVGWVVHRSNPTAGARTGPDGIRRSGTATWYLPAILASSYRCPSAPR